MGAFGTVSLLHETRSNIAELVQLMQMFMQRRGLRIFRYERTRSTLMNPKLMFSCVSSCLGAFGTISLLHKTRSKTGRTDAINANVHGTKWRRNFSLRTHPIHTNGPYTHVLVRFTSLVGIVSLLNWAWCKMGRNGTISAKVHATKWHPNFSLWEHPIHANGP